MMRVALLVLCAVAAARATETTESPTINRHRRSSATEVFLNIIAERPKGSNNIKAPILPVQLPIQLGGQGGITLPVLVVPVPVYVNNPDTCSVKHHETLAQKPEEATQAPQLNVPYVQNRQQFALTQSTPEAVDQQQPEPVIPQQALGKAPEPVIPQQAELVVPLQPEPVAPQQPEPVVPQPQSVVPESPEPIQINQQLEADYNQAPIQINQQLQQTETQKPVYTYNQVYNNIKPVKSYASANVVIPAPVVKIPAFKKGVHFGTGNRVNFGVETQPHTSVEPVSFQQATEIQEEKNPFSDGSAIFATSEQIIQAFRRESPVAPDLPVVISGLDLPPRLPVKRSISGYTPSITAASPPRPDFNRSLHLRVDLAVPTSDYTEAYDIQWHAESNTAKTVVEDGSTVIYRAPLDDGRVQFLEITLERADGQVVRHCTLSPLVPPTAADKSFPGLPAFDEFDFVGYTSAEGRSLVESWRRVVKGGPGEGGAAEGESLTFTHEMLVVRDRGQALPLRYTVVTDSSVLGPASDSYTHRYRQLPEPTAPVLPDTNRECDTFDEFHEHDHHHDHQHDQEQQHDQEHHHDQSHHRGDENQKYEYQSYEHHQGQKRDVGLLLTKVVNRFDPIREFAGPTRDTRYDSLLTKFKNDFKRKYLNPAEEAVRKNLFIRSSRFIDAGNRLSSGFKMGTNFFADRLDDEVNVLLGVQALPKGAFEPGLVSFPYSNNELKKIEIDDEFDWRPLGAVSPVRFQDTMCSSCWAFAVAGSTEGALFKKTNKLVPLSPQCLVDCGKPFGTNGCNGTWPSFAYDYVQARGLPAWDEYTAYQAKVLECKDQTVPPVTHINGHVKVTPNSKSALKVAIKNHAPSVVIVDAKAQSFIYYKSGVLKDKRCGQNKPKLNHAVLAVGWGNKDGAHFIIKNSWSDKWGEQGYIRIAPESCALLERPSYSLLEEPDIDREELRAAARSLKSS